jgi:hypothetical protein
MVPPAPALLQQWWLPTFDIWDGLHMVGGALAAAFVNGRCRPLMVAAH